MKIVQIKIKDLKFSEYNPRIMPEQELRKLEKSILEFGFVDPVVVNQYKGRENVIIGGHQRVRAAQRLGMEKVPVFYVNLKPDKEKVLNLALNRIQGSWDEEKLGALLTDLEDKGDIDLLLSGFDSSEIDNLLRDFKEDKDEDFKVMEELEKIKKPDSRRGGLYQLGPHRLMCGDSTLRGHVAKLVDCKPVDMLFTDPPYNVGYESRGKNKEKWKKAYGDDNYSQEEYFEFCSKAFYNFKTYLKPGGVYYICSGWTSWAVIWAALAQINLKPRGCIIWDKGHGGMGWSDYWYQHELMAQGFNIKINKDKSEVYEMIAYGFDTKARHYFAKRGGARTSDVWRIPRHPNNKYEHPTQKPLKLVENAIYNSSKRGEIVLDLFGGSGSTLIAAERTGRIAYLMELSPLFCDVIRKRYEKFIKKGS